MEFRKVLIYLICISVCSCNGIEDETVLEENIIELKVYDFDGNTEIDIALGNGETIVTLKAQIPENANSKTVKFKASEGATFVGVDGNEDTDIANTEGIAETKLKLPLGKDPLFLSAEITSGENTFTSETTLNLVGVDEVITLEILDTNGNNLSSLPKADGVTLVRLKATVSYNQNVFNKVTFEKSNGEFLSVSGNNAVQQTDKNGIATIDFRLPKIVDKIYFSAKVGTDKFYLDQQELDVLRAYPDQLIIEPERITITENTTNSITVFLTREFGFVSEDTEAIFESYQIINGEEIKVGRFTGLVNAVTDIDGKITVQFKTDTGDFDISLPVIIRVTSQNDSGQIVQSNISINLE